MTRAERIRNDMDAYGPARAAEVRAMIQAERIRNDVDACGPARAAEVRGMTRPAQQGMSLIRQVHNGKCG